MDDRKISIKLSFIYIALYGAIATFLPYLTPYLQSRGLSYTQIGIALAVNALVTLFFQPIWGYLTDKYFNKRLTLLIITLVCSVLIFNFIFSFSYIYILISIILIVSFQGSIIPISDAYTYEIINVHRSIQYGRIRLMGSIGFAFSALITGYAISFFGINVSYFIYSVLLLIAAYLIYTIDFKLKDNVRKASFQDFAELIKDPRIIIFMLSVAVVNISMGMHSTYLYLLVENTGGDVSKLGIVLFAVAISELPTMFYGNKIIKRFGELNLYLIGIILFALRLFINSILGSYQMVIVVQLMQSITFVFYLLAALQYINSITQVEVKTSAVTFFAAMCGLGAFIGNLGGGILLERISIFSLYRISSVICLSAVIFVFVLKGLEAKTDAQCNKLSNPKHFVNR